MSLKHELQTIISGSRKITNGDSIQTVLNYLRKSKAAGSALEEKEFIKQQEEKIILAYCKENNFFFGNLNEERYLAEGAEQKVYLEEDGWHVVKLNDAIFYLAWEDYLINLLLHNYFFPATSYDLVGFYVKEDKLFAAVKQQYIHVTEDINLDHVKEFMLANGFTNTRNNDYQNSSLGIIVEDLHDENVLNSDGSLFFIDTVFYLTKDFFIQ